MTHSACAGDTKVFALDEAFGDTRFRRKSSNVIGCFIIGSGARNDWPAAAKRSLRAMRVSLRFMILFTLEESQSVLDGFIGLTLVCR